MSKTTCTTHISTQCKITRASVTSMTTCTASSILATKFYSSVQNVCEEMYNTYRTRYKITRSSVTSMTTCTACTVVTKLYSWVRNVNEEMYFTYRTHYNITPASRNSTTNSFRETYTALTVLTRKFHFSVRNIFPNLYRTYGNLDKSLMHL
jgi:hypothetical protein